MWLIRLAVLGKHRTIPCINCGYDLTGLPREGVCPECGLPLKQTFEATEYLRAYPLWRIRRVRRAVLLLAWSTTAPIAGIPAGALLASLWIVIASDTSWFGLLIGPLLGCLVAILCFAAGSIVITSRIPGRRLHPEWVRQTLRWCGPLAAACALVGPFLSECPFFRDTLPTMAFRLIAQASTLAAMSSVILVTRALARLTRKAADGGQGFNWLVVSVLAFIWGTWYWLLPMQDGFADEQDGRWGEGWALAAQILQFGMLWRLADAVAVEAAMAELNAAPAFTGAQAPG